MVFNSAVDPPQHSGGTISRPGWLALAGKRIIVDQPRQRRVRA